MSLFKKAKPTMDDAVRWSNEAARGTRAQAFLNSEFWRKDLEPYLNDEMVDWALKGVHSGGEWPGVEKVAFQSVLNGAAIAVLRRFKATLEEWVTAGKEAVAKLQTMRAKEASK